MFSHLTSRQGERDVLAEEKEPHDKKSVSLAHVAHNENLEALRAEHEAQVQKLLQENPREKDRLNAQLLKSGPRLV